MALEPLIYDEETGLPKLPDGYAWEVRENSLSGSDDYPEERPLIIRIVSREVEKLTWFGRLIGVKPEVDWTPYGHEYSFARRDCANRADDLKSAATDIYNSLRDEELKRTELEKFIGIYPPKSIL